MWIYWESIRKFSTRMSEHRDYVKSEKISKPSGEHFNLSGHNVSHLKGMAIEKVYSIDPFVLEAREEMYIKIFDTYRKVLNREPWKLLWIVLNVSSHWNLYLDFIWLRIFVVNRCYSTRNILTNSHQKSLYLNNGWTPI